MDFIELKRPKSLKTLSCPDKLLPRGVESTYGLRKTHPVDSLLSALGPCKNFFPNNYMLNPESLSPNLPKPLNLNIKIPNSLPTPLESVGKQGGQDVQDVDAFTIQSLWEGLRKMGPRGWQTLDHMKVYWFRV